MKTILKICLMAAMMGEMACSPQTRLSRMLMRHPELTLSDTLVFRDTVNIPAIVADTVVGLATLNDTVFLRNDRLEIALQATPETLYVKGKCKADTIYRTHRVAVEKVKVVKPNRLNALIATVPWLVTGLIAIALLFVVLVYRKNQIKSLLS